MDETITYLEMTDPGELRPGREVDGLSLETVPSESPLVRATQVRIGTPYEWGVTLRTEQRWAEHLANPHLHQRLIRHHDDIAGATEFEVQPDGDVEITLFGLVPEHVDQGIGGAALTLVLREAWTLPPRDTDIRRVWLHTSTVDHPHALPNYQARGLRPFRTRVNHRP